MQIVWTQKEATVFSVMKELKYKKCLAYTTVMTVMMRLTKKGILEREKRGKMYFYKPSQCEESYIRDFVKNTVTRLVEKFGDVAKSALIEELSKLK